MSEASVDLAVDLKDAAPTQRLLAALNGVSDERLMSLTRLLRDIGEATFLRTIAGSSAEASQAQRLVDLSRETPDLADVLSSLITLRFSDSLSSKEDTLSFFFGAIVDVSGLESLEAEAASVHHKIPSSDIGALRLSDASGFLNAAFLFNKFVGDWRSTYVSRGISLLHEGAKDYKRLRISLLCPPVIAALLAGSSMDSIVKLEESAQGKVDRLDQTLSDGARLALTSAFVRAQKAASLHSRTWTTGVFVCAVLGIVTPVYAFSLDTQVLKDVGAFAAMAIKALTGVPFFALSVYCGKVAGHHREVSRHLLILVAQLLTVSAYGANLDKSERDQLVFGLGQRAFASPDFIVDPDKSTASIDDLNSLIDKLGKAITAATSGGKKE